MSQQVGNPEYRQRLIHLFGMIKNGWWIVLFCAVAVFACVFFILSTFESRFQSVALVQGWRIPDTKQRVSPAELEIRINSPDLMRLAKANYAANSDTNTDTPGDLVNPIVRVSWVTSSSVLRFVATANSPEAGQGILAEALVILIDSIRPDDNAISEVRQHTAELEQSLADLRRLAAIQITRHENDASDRHMLSSLIAELSMVRNIREIYSEIYKVSTRISVMNQYSYAPTSDDIIQAPTLADAPLPSRALSTALLAGIFVVLLGFGVCVLLAAFFSLEQDSGDIADA